METVQTSVLRRSSAVFLQVLVVLIGIATLALMLWEPHLEGRNANATTFEIYFKDPFLAYVYLGSIPFFVALSKAFKLLGYIRDNRIFSTDAVKALRTIKLCAFAVLAFVIGAEVIIMLHTSDDRAGGVFMGLVALFGCVVVAAVAATSESILQNAVEMKSENDLTV